jgi:carbon-monoxide dehydrogenase large subunit
VEVQADGAIVVRTGSTASGQGHPTIWRQVVGDALSVPPDTVRFIAGDTAEVARGIGTFGSRSTQLGAAAAARAAARLVDVARSLAADRLEARAEDLVLTDGAFRVAGVPGIAVPLAQIAAGLEADGAMLAEEEYFVPGAMTFPYGVFVAVVGVDMGTGTVHVRHIAAVNDCGRLINPRLAADQVVGSILQGLGQALLEEIVYDEWGQLTTSTLADYLLPTAANAPRISLGWIETPAPSNPLGAKGIGESGCVGVPQAVVNGALDALAPWNVTDLQMPLSPDRVWQAIRTASRPG